MGGLFMPKSKPADPVKPMKPVEMPDPDSPAAIEARRKATADAMQRGGRSSTIMTGDADRGNYTAATLGGG